MIFLKLLLIRNIVVGISSIESPGIYRSDSRISTTTTVAAHSKVTVATATPSSAGSRPELPGLCISTKTAEATVPLWHMAATTRSTVTAENGTHSSSIVGSVGNAVAAVAAPAAVGMFGISLAAVTTAAAVALVVAAVPASPAVGSEATIAPVAPLPMK